MGERMPDQDDCPYCCDGAPGEPRCSHCLMLLVADVDEKRRAAERERDEARNEAARLTTHIDMLPYGGGCEIGGVEDTIRVLREDRSRAQGEVERLHALIASESAACGVTEGTPEERVRGMRAAWQETQERAHLAEAHDALRRAEARELEALAELDERTAERDAIQARLDAAVADRDALRGALEAAARAGRPTWAPNSRCCSVCLAAVPHHATLCWVGAALATSPEAAPTGEDAGRVARLTRAVTKIADGIRAELDRGYVLTEEPGAGPAWRRRWNALLAEAESALSAPPPQAATVGHRITAGLCQALGVEFDDPAPTRGGEG